MPQRILGIDIGSYSVKVAELSRSFKSFEFTAFYERRVGENELLSREESQAIALQGLIDDHNLQWDAVCVGFPGQLVSSRLLTFPFSSRKKIDQTIEFEIENYVPFHLEEIVLDYAVLSSSKDFSRVVALYTPKGEVAKKLSMFQGISIDPRHMCVEGVELTNLVNLGMVPPEGSFAIIDIGHEKTTVAIFQGKHLGYVRAISIAGKAVTEAIAKRLGVPADEAEKLKIEMGQLGSGDQVVIDDLSRDVMAAVKQTVDELLLHIRQTIFAYNDMENVPVEGIYLCGGSSRIPGLDSYISDFLKQNVAFLNVTEFHFSRLERAEAHRHVIPQALALALKEVAGPALPDVNFRRGEFAFRGDVEQLGGGLRRAGIALVVIIFLALLNFTVKYYTLKNRVEMIRDNAAQLVLQALPGTAKKAVATTSGALSVIKGKKAETADRIAKLKAAMGLSPLNILKEISELMPPKNEVTIDVEDISIAPDRVTLSGRTGSFETVDKIKMAMEKAENFKNVTTGNVRKGTKGEIKFDLSMEIKEPGDTAGKEQ